MMDNLGLSVPRVYKGSVYKNTKWTRLDGPKHRSWNKTCVNGGELTCGTSPCKDGLS